MGDSLASQVQVVAVGGGHPGRGNPAADGAYLESLAADKEVVLHTPVAVGGRAEVEQLEVELEQEAGSAEINTQNSHQLNV